jgi:hypothetical protein
MTESAIVRVDSSKDRQLMLGDVPVANPAAMVAMGKTVANTLAQVIRDGHLAITISGRQYVRCEGWTTLMAMLGITAHEVEVTEDPKGGFVATVELRRVRDGAVVGRASALVGADEKTWGQRPRYARRSMAITRAVAKAGRLSFSWIMVLADMEPTPAEEIESEPAPAPPVAAATPTLPPDLTRLNALIAERKIGDDKQALWRAHFRVAALTDLTQQQVDSICKRIEAEVASVTSPA